MFSTILLVENHIDSIVETTLDIWLNSHAANSPSAYLYHTYIQLCLQPLSGKIFLVNEQQTIGRPITSQN